MNKMNHFDPPYNSTKVKMIKMNKMNHFDPPYNSAKVKMNSFSFILIMSSKDVIKNNKKNWHSFKIFKCYIQQKIKIATFTKFFGCKFQLRLFTCISFYFSKLYLHCSC